MINNWTVEARIYGDVEMRFTPSGKPVTQFRASVYHGKNEDGSYKPSTWINVVCWDKFAEIVNERGFESGDNVLVGGSVKMREWEKDGIKKSSLEVTCTNLLKIEWGTARVPKIADDELPW